MTGKEFAEYGDNQLREIASKIAETIVIYNTPRATTKPEKEIIINIAVSAMAAYRYRHRDLGGILDMAEFALLEFFENCNTYDTIYNPLRKAMETW